MKRLVIALLFLVLSHGQVLAALPTMPSHVNEAREQVLEKAHKQWRRDAMVTEIKLQWSPQEKPEKFWLLFRLFSPSNRHTAFITQGGEDDDAIVEDRDVAIEDVKYMYEIPKFAIDLPDAIILMRKTGYTDTFSLVDLSVRKANEFEPVLAWVFSLNSGKQFPFAVDAQTGKEVPWEHVMDRPPTDKEMAESMQRWIHRNDPPAAAGGGGGGGCISGVQVMYGMCMDSGGSFVDPLTGNH
jgi:hypothetical protein